MKVNDFVKKRVAKYFWKDDLNCSTTTLKILAENFEIELNKQIIDAAIGLNGAGRYGAQCGLVEGTLIFLGIFLRKNNIPNDKIVNFCREFAGLFEKKFNSLQCSILRPEGFHPDNPLHLCESLTCQSIEFSINYISNIQRTKDVQ